MLKYKERIPNTTNTSQFRKLLSNYPICPQFRNDFFTQSQITPQHLVCMEAQVWTRPPRFRVHAVEYRECTLHLDVPRISVRCLDRDLLNSPSSLVLFVFHHLFDSDHTSHRDTGSIHRVDHFFCRVLSRPCGYSLFNLRLFFHAMVVLEVFWASEVGPIDGIHETFVDCVAVSANDDVTWGVRSIR